MLVKLRTRFESARGVGPGEQRRQGANRRFGQPLVVVLIQSHHALGRQGYVALSRTRHVIRVQLGGFIVYGYEQDRLLPALRVRIDIGCSATTASRLAVPDHDHYVAAVNDRMARQFISLFARSGGLHGISDAAMLFPDLVELVDRRGRAEVTTVVFRRQWQDNLEPAPLALEDFIRD